MNASRDTPTARSNRAPGAVSDRAPAPGKSRAFWLLVGLMLCGHAGLAFDCARRLTVTHDEYWHLPVGLLNLSEGRFHFDNLNPPLVRAWAALPLFLSGERIHLENADADAFEIGDIFVSSVGERYDRLYAVSRSMIVILSVLTGVVIAVWARQWFGDAAALLATLLWSTSPTFLMSASLVTTDLGAALFFVATLYLLWRFAGQPTWRNASLFGLCLGLAQLAKFTSILLYPLAIVLWFAVRIGNDEINKGNRGGNLSKWGVALLLSLFVLNAGYLFQGSFSAFESFQFGSKALSKLSGLQEPLGGVPVPFPRDYVEGVDRQRHIMESAHPVYLDGQLQVEGFPHYNLMAVWYKIPHATQLFIVLTALFLVMPGGKRRLLRRQLVLLLPVALLFLIASGSGMQLGIRYLLPVLPFLVLFAGQSARWFDRKQYPARCVMIAVLAVLTPLSVRFHPHHLAYFNELAGGPVNGHAHLIDSNIDWGQDLRGLKHYVDENNINKIGLAYFGMLPPSELGIDYFIPWRQTDVVPSRQAVKPGWYAISTNFLMGRPHTIREPDGTVGQVGPHEFGVFRTLKPRARIGYSIFIYHVPERPGVR